MVIEPETGQELDASALEGVSVEIKDGGGRTIPGYYSPHPPENPTDYYWVVPWTIPEGFPTGLVQYDIIVQASRTTKTYRFHVPPAHLTVLKGTYSSGKTAQ